MSDVPRCKLCGCPDGPDYGDPHECPPGFKVSPPPPTVPRVARSVDDLRVGMTVIRRFAEGGWRPYPVVVGRGDLHRGMPNLFSGAEVVVILSDPPARDWLVPATQMEALRGACDDFGPEKGVGTSTIIRAARAVLDAAREVEHE